MRKKILLVGFVFLLVGCTKIENTEDYITLVNNCIKEKKITNQVSLGYKYYIPKGLKKIRDYNYNQVFLTEDSKIYLYVDIISYFYKKELNYDKSNNTIYYKEIINGKKNGYIEITKEEEDYFVKMVYNFSKIEAYTKKENLNKIITVSSILLNSIYYNDNLIKRVIEGDFGEFSEKTYKVKKPIDSNNSFSQYLEEYAGKEEKNDEKKKQLPDE